MSPFGLPNRLETSRASFLFLSFNFKRVRLTPQTSHVCRKSRLIHLNEDKRLSRPNSLAIRPSVLIVQSRDGPPTPTKWTTRTVTLHHPEPTRRHGQAAVGRAGLPLLPLELFRRPLP